MGVQGSPSSDSDDGLDITVVLIFSLIVVAVCLFGGIIGCCYLKKQKNRCELTGEDNSETVDSSGDVHDLAVPQLDESNLAKEVPLETAEVTLAIEVGEDSTAVEVGNEETLAGNGDEQAPQLCQTAEISQAGEDVNEVEDSQVLAVEDSQVKEQLPLPASESGCCIVAGLPASWQCCSANPVQSPRI
jgi:hypothetical protein